MIEINYNIKDFDLKINSNTDLGKKILNLIKKSDKQENIIKIKFNSTKSFNSKNINSVPNVNIIELGKKFNTPIDLSKYTILKEISIGDKFNSYIIWSDSIEKIVFSYLSLFNQKINNYPKNLKHLVFGQKFNQEVNNLSTNIKYLKFGGEFNKKINNLPNSLEYLYLGSEFNQDLDLLPESLITLEFEKSFSLFSKSLINLPNNLKKIIFPENYMYNDKFNTLPNNINNLDALPNNINYLELPKSPNINKLPEKIEIVEIKFNFFTNLVNLKNFKNIRELNINDYVVDLNFVENLLENKNKLININKINITICLNDNSKIDLFNNNLLKINKIYKITEKKDFCKNLFILERIYN